MATTPSKKRSLWLAGAVAVLAVAACTAGLAPVPGNVAAEASAVTAAGSFPATFIGVSATGSRLAVYSAADGRVLRYLTAAEPGAGRVAGLALSADGGIVVFGLFGGTCTASIDTVPVGGGAERVLIPSLILPPPRFPNERRS